MIILGTNSIKDTGYDVANSLRFNTGSSDYIVRTFGSGGDRKTFTFSWWIKRVGVGGSDYFISGMSGSSEFNMFFDSSGRFGIDDFNGSAYGFQLRTNRVFRDPSAWYHFVLAFDTTQGTSTNRIKLYINGTQYTWDNQTTYPSQNYDTQANVNGRVLEIGRLGGSYNTAYADMYLAEMVFVNGSALAPTDFGEFDSDSPTIWKPIDVSGLTFSTNGFYLDFEDSSALGNDVSGNNNDFTVNNLTAIDQSTDTCTNNFATMNPLFKADGSQIAYSEGNLKTTASNESQKNAVSTIAVTSGKWYCEMVSRTGTNYPGFGIMDTGSTLQTSLSYLGSTADSYCMFQGGLDYNNGSENDIGTSWGENVIMGIAIDLDSSTKTIKYYKAGSEIHSRTISTPANGYAFAVSHRTNGTITEINFGSPPYSESGGNSDGNGFGNFSMSVPSGYYALNTKNLAEFG